MEVTSPAIPNSTLPLGSGPDLAKLLDLDKAIIEARKEFPPLHRSGSNTAFDKRKPHRFSTQDDVYACVMPTLTARAITVSSCVWMVEGLKLQTVGRENGESGDWRILVVVGEEFTAGEASHCGTG